MVQILRLHVFSIIILSVQILQTSSSTCSNYLIGSTQASLNCGSPHLYTSTDLKIPSPYKILAVSFILNPISYCVTGGSDVVLFSVLITPPGTTTQKQIMYVSYAYATSTIKIAAEDTSGLQSLIIQSAPTFLNKPISIYIGVNLANSNPSANHFIGFGTLGMGNSLTTQSYGSDWVFDSSTVISICADKNGNYGVNCVVQNLKVAYKLPVQLLTMTFSNAMTMIGNYLINEGSGNSLANSQGTLGSASLSSPVWTSDSGLEFNSISNQYIQITNFIPSGEALYATTSIGFAFYLKIDTAPTTDALIVSHQVNSLGKQIFSLALTSTMALKLNLDGAISVTSQTVSVGEWTAIYVFYAFTQGGWGLARVYIDGVFTSAVPFVITSPVPTDFTTADTVKIGGVFSGNLRRIQIYSPASGGFASGANLCDSSACSLEIGYSNPPTCLETVCSAGYYPIFDTCEACPINCATCTDQDTCQSCKSGYYLVGDDCVQCPTGKYVATLTTCIDCPTHCSSCMSSSLCTSCDAGYGISGSLCMLCPAGTYLSTDQICKEFSQPLQDALTSSQLLNSVVTQIANIISKGNAISFSAAVSGKIFSQIKYLNISYSGELEIALLTWKPSFVSLGLTPDIPASMIEKIPVRSVPYVFEKYDVPASFLENFWENLGVLIATTLSWLLLKGIENNLSPQEKPRLASLSRKIRVMAQSFLITALYEVFGDLVMFSIIEYRSFAFGWNLSLLSFMVSVILLIIMFLSFLHQTTLLRTYQTLKRQGDTSNNLLLQQFTKNHEGSQVYWKDLKDYSLSPQLFFSLLSGRDIIFSLILATMFEYPVAQTLIILIFDCLMITYLLIKRPFQSWTDFAQQLFFEFIGLIVGITVSINSILDAGKYEAVGVRNNIGKLVIVCNLLFNFVTAIFMLIVISQVLVEFYKKHHENKAKNVQALKLQNQRSQDLSRTSRNINSDQTLFHETISNNPQETSQLELLHHHVQRPYHLNINRRKMPRKPRSRINPPSETSPIQRQEPLNRHLDRHIRLPQTYVTRGSERIPERIQPSSHQRRPSPQVNGNRMRAGDRSRVNQGYSLNRRR